MATIDSQSVIDDIIAGKYPEDNCVKIVKYTNAWGAPTFGCIYAGEPLNRYKASKFVRNPVTYWKKSKGK